MKGSFSCFVALSSVLSALLSINAAQAANLVVPSQSLESIQGTKKFFCLQTSLGEKLVKRMRANGANKVQVRIALPPKFNAVLTPGLTKKERRKARKRLSQWHVACVNKSEPLPPPASTATPTPEAPQPTPQPTAPQATPTPNPSNLPPTVSARLVNPITLSERALLIADATDSQTPESLSYIWSMASGPGAVTFSDISARATRASFSAPGSYIIQVQVSDGSLSSVDAVQVVVSGLSGSACSDGIDNDGDGRTDFPSDPGCDSAEDAQEAFLPSLTFYVNSATGSDESAGTSPSTAWATTARAVTALNQNRSASILVHLAPGTYGAISGMQSRTAWAMFRGEAENKPLVQCAWFGFYPGPQDARIILDRLQIHASCQDGGSWIGVRVKDANYIRVYDSHIESTDEHATNPADGPIAFNVRASAHVWAIDNLIKGSRYGLNLWGNNLVAIGNEISHQFGDGMRIVSADTVLVENNFIHSVADYQSTGEHIDGIQFFASGPAGAYPQPKNVILRGNRLFNLPGQMIFIQSNWTDQIGFIENIVIENNVLGPKVPDSWAYPIQLQGIKNFIMRGNTVAQQVIIRAQSEGIVYDNLIGSLSFTENSIVSYHDHNIVGGFSNDTPLSAPPGPNSLVQTVSYVNPALFDMTPTTPQVCAGSSQASFVGALPCQACSGGAPQARFGTIDRLVRRGTPVTFDGEAAKSCGITPLSTYDFTFDDGSSASISAPKPVTHLYSSVGSYKTSLAVTDGQGQSSSAQAFVHVLPTINDPTLQAFFPLDGTTQDFSSYNRSLLWTGGEANYTEGIQRKAASTGAPSAFLELGSGLINGLTDFTVAVWAKRDTSSTSSVLLHRHVTLNISLTETGIAYGVGNASAYVSGSAQHPSALSTDWHHYAMSYDAQTIRFYIDGALVSEKPQTGALRSGSWPLRFGNHTFESGVVFDGSLDDLRLYSRTLPPAEIAALADNP